MKWSFITFCFSIIVALQSNAQRHYRIPVKKIYHETPPNYTNLPPEDSIELNALNEIETIVIMAYPPDDEVSLIWNQIKMSLQNTKYEKSINNCYVKKASINGFFSTNINDSNFVFYDAEFYNQFRNLKNVDINYLIKFSLAHELGHVFNNDLISNIRTKEKETSADLVACRLLCGLNEGTNEGIKNVLFTLVGASRDDLYPNKGDRIRNIDSFFLTGLCAYDVESSSMRVGTQIWGLKDLNTSYYRNGDLILKANNISEWADYCNKKVGCWCYFNFKIENETKYGKLYNWYAVHDDRGLAPNGWHIPTKSEWDDLEESIKGMRVTKLNRRSYAYTYALVQRNSLKPISSDLFCESYGGVLISEFYGVWQKNDGSESNVYHGDFRGLDEYRFWWASDNAVSFIKNPNYKGSRSNSEGAVAMRDDYKTFGMSVRLVRNK